MTKLKKTYCILSLIFAIAVFVAVLFASQNRTTVYAASMDPDSIDSLDNTAANTSTGSGSESDSKGGLSISINNDEAGVASEVRALLLLTIIAVSPSLLIMLTSYTRIVIVLHFLRTAIGTQTAPPNQILIGLALFLTFFIMWPTFQQINENAIQPLDNGDITIEEALKEAVCHQKVTDMTENEKYQEIKRNVFDETQNAASPRMVQDIKDILKIR